MTRKHWNVIYCIGWLTLALVAWARWGPVAALVVYFLPVMLIVTLMKVTSHWMTPRTFRVDLVDQHRKSRSNQPEQDSE